MSIVTRGLGGGSLVAGGLGLTEPAAPGEMSALLGGAGSLTGTLATTGETPAPIPYGGRAAPRTTTRPPRRKASMSAVLAGTGHVNATAQATVREITGFDDLELLLALELV